MSIITWFILYHSVFYVGHVYYKDMLESIPCLYRVVLLQSQEPEEPAAELYVDLERGRKTP